VRRKEPATLSEIADSLGWRRSSTFNLIQTLADRGYLCEPGRRSGYYPSSRGLRSPSRSRLPSRCRNSPMHWSQNWETGETAAVGAPAGINAIFVDVLESPAAVLRAGRQSPADISIDAVEAGLRRSAERGYRQSLADFSPDLARVALPLPVGDRRLSIVVAGPMFRILDRLELAADIIRRAVKRRLARRGRSNEPILSHERAGVTPPKKGREECVSKTSWR
jgi:DNA-binding IclR family transcriptional regulator